MCSSDMTDRGKKTPASEIPVIKKVPIKNADQAGLECPPSCLGGVWDKVKYPMSKLKTPIPIIPKRALRVLESSLKLIRFCSILTSMILNS